MPYFPINKKLYNTKYEKCLQHIVSRSEEHAFQPLLLDLRTDFSLRSMVPSRTYSLIIFPFSIKFFFFSKEQLYVWLYVCGAIICVWLSKEQTHIIVP